MRRTTCIAAAAFLTAALVGCQAQTEPEFSPDGKTLAYADNQDLHLRIGTTDKTIGQRVEGNVAWSLDGGKIAFEEDSETVIYDLRTKRRIEIAGRGGPYAWQGTLLAAVRSEPNSEDSTLCLLRADTGAELERHDFTFVPDAMWPVPGGLLLRGPGQYHYFDGYAPIPLPLLEGWTPVGPQDGSGLVLSKGFVDDGYRQGVSLSTWSGSPFDPPSPVLRVRLAGLLGDHLITIEDVEASSNARVVAVHATVYRGATPESNRRIEEIVANYAVLSNAPKEMPDEISKEFDRLLEGAKWEYWAVVRTEDGALKKWPLAVNSDIAMNSQGTTLAILNDEGTTLVPIAKP